MILNSLRTKIILIAVSCSLLSILLVLLITPTMVESRFVNDAKALHLANFTIMLKHYHQTLNANTQQGAISFNRTLPPPSQQPLHMLVKGRAGIPTHDLLAINQDFRFVIADANGWVLLPFNNFEAGQQLTESQRKSANLIYDNGNFLGYSIATGEVPLTPKDVQYIDSLKQSLLITGSISVIVAWLFGLLMTTSLRNRLHKLITATQHLSERRLPEQIEVKGKDELAVLTQEFNAMSYKLTLQYHRLRHSHDTIEEQAKTLKKLSVTDELTQLFNRRYFNESLNQYVEDSNKGGQELSLVLCDIDHFKQVNDNFSHQIGDQVLKKVAQLMQECTRSEDIVARVGGEELVILMPKTHKQKATEIAERVRAKMEDQNWSTIALGLRMTMSFGVSCLSETHNADTLINAADTLLYEAKDAGRNRVCG